MYLKITSFITILLVLGMVGGSFAADSKYKTDNTQLIS